MSKLYVTNNHTDEMEFQIDGGGTKVIEPGKTEHISLLDPNSPQNLANQHAGLISISEKNPEKTPEKTTEKTPEKTTEKSAS